MENENNTNLNNPYGSGYDNNPYSNGYDNNADSYGNNMNGYNANGYNNMNNYGNGTNNYNNTADYSDNMNGYNINGYKANGYNLNGNQVNPKKSKKGPVIAIIIVAVLLIGGIAAWFIISNGKAKNEPLDVAKAYAEAFVNADTDGVMEIVIPNATNEEEAEETFDDFFDDIEDYGMTFDTDTEDFDVLGEYSDDEMDAYLDELEGSISEKAKIKAMCDVVYSVDYNMTVYGLTYTGTISQTLIMVREGNTWYLLDLDIDMTDPTLIETEDTEYEEDTQETEATTADESDAEEETSEDSSETSYSVIDEATGKELFTVISYDDEKIYSFIEPDGWVVDKDYVDDLVNYADTQFFLDNEEIGDYMTISCSVDSGIVYYYDEENGSAEAAQKYSLEEIGYTTTYNSYGYDIFKYTYEYDESVYYYTALLYVGEYNSLVIELPACDEFDTLEEVEAFLADNF